MANGIVLIAPSAPGRLSVITGIRQHYGGLAIRRHFRHHRQQRFVGG
jgi:hypothetical protein